MFSAYVPGKMITATGLPSSGVIVSACASASAIVVKKTSVSAPGQHNWVTPGQHDWRGFGGRATNSVRPGRTIGCAGPHISPFDMIVRSTIRDVGACWMPQTKKHCCSEFELKTITAPCRLFLRLNECEPRCCKL